MRDGGGDGKEEEWSGVSCARCGTTTEIRYGTHPRTGRTGKLYVCPDCGLVEAAADRAPGVVHEPLTAEEGRWV